MKVLHVLYRISVGGGATVLQELTQALVQNGLHCQVATTDGGCPQSDVEWPVSAVPLHVFPTRFPASWWPCYSPSLSRFLRAETKHFDLVHTHALWDYPSYAACRAARQCNVPYVLSPHGGFQRQALRYSRHKKYLCMPVIQRPMLRFAAGVHCLTEEEQLDVERQVAGAATFLVPNGIPCDLSNAFDSIDPSDFLARYPGLAGKRIILFVGRFVAEKGLDVLVRSFSRIAGQFPDTVLLFVGPDGENRVGVKAEITAMLRALGLQDRVICTESLSGCDLLSAYVCATLLVLPSRYEAFSLSALEAMAARLPVIVSENCAFLRRMVRKAGAGLVVPLRDEALAEALAAVLSDESRAICMGRNGRRLVADYTWPAIARSMANHYQELVKQYRC